MNYIIPRALLVFASLALASAAFAQHNSEHDVYIHIDDPVVEDVAKKAKLGKLGDSLYDTQEGVHEEVKETTGEEVEHYYIHICSGDECVPVDPVRFSN